MAKESMKAREVKRAKLVAKFAAKREKYLSEGDYDALQTIPKNASPVRLHNRCKLTGRPKGYMFIGEILFLLIVIGVSILLVQGTRKVPVQYAKRVVGNKQYGGVRQYIPLKINAAGVMPIIFAQAIMNIQPFPE